MKLILAACLLLFVSCNDNERVAEEKSENDMDAARNFLQAALSGDYEKASGYMLQDSTNEGYLDVTKRNYVRLGVDEKRNLRESSLRFFDTKKINDSITVTVFSNSYKNDKDTLRIVRLGGRWLVDLKYLFEHNDSIFTQQNRIDTINK